MKDKITRFYNKNRIIILIILLSLIIKTIYVVSVDTDKEFGDQSWYIELAKNLHDKNNFSRDGINPEINRNPLYPTILSIFYFFIKDFYLIAKLINILLGSLIPLILYKISLIYFNKRTSKIVAFLSLIYPPFTIYSIYVLTEIFYTFLLLISYYFLLKYISNKRINYGVLAFVLLGFSTLTRGETFFLTIILIVFLFFYDKKSNSRHLFIFAIIFLIILLPLSIRNYLVADYFSPLEISGGPVNLWFALYKNICDKNKLIEYKDKYITKLTYKEQNAFYKNQIIDLLRKKPMIYVHTLINNFKELFIGSHTVAIPKLNKLTFKESLNKKNYVFAFIKIVLFSFNIFITIIGFLGMYLYRKNKFILILLLPFIFKVLLHALTQGNARYLIPVYPFLLIFSALSINKYINNGK